MKRTVPVLICFIIVFTCCSQVFAINYNLDEIIENTSSYILKTVTNPQVGSVGGEWAVIGLARSGIEIPKEYFEIYYRNAEKYTEDCGGILHDKKYTEYARLSIAIRAIGKDPENVGGYNLISPLTDYEKVENQGINGPVWAITALDCIGFQSEVKEKYVDYILNHQLSDGGWALFGEISDPDITGMTLQALSNYQTDENVKQATEQALLCMSKMQNINGGFSSYGTENSESTAQMIIALASLGIKYDDERFVKNGKTLLDNLMQYYSKGGFRHSYENSETNLMATEQALCALASVKRFDDRKNSFYNMSDTEKNTATESDGFQEKNTSIKKKEIKDFYKTFGDIQGHKNRTEIEELAKREIINGKNQDSFEPDSDMTRAEFATIIVRALGISSDIRTSFYDVSEKDWFYEYINTAYAFGIINGISETEFNPDGKITRQEAAVMITRSADLCGISTKTDKSELLNILAGFSDYKEAAEWAEESLAFCFENDILSDEALEIKPYEEITRGEIAFMLYNMLKKAELL